jgi:hypothetical protein
MIAHFSAAPAEPKESPASAPTLNRASNAQRALFHRQHSTFSAPSQARSHPGTPTEGRQQYR